MLRVTLTHFHRKRMQDRDAQRSQKRRQTLQRHKARDLAPSTQQVSDPKKQPMLQTYVPRLTLGRSSRLPFARFMNDWLIDGLEHQRSCGSVDPPCGESTNEQTTNGARWGYTKLTPVEGQRTASPKPSFEKPQRKHYYTIEKSQQTKTKFTKQRTSVSRNQSKRYETPRPFQERADPPLRTLFLLCVWGGGGGGEIQRSPLI
ncbi:unnamed protein product, partial [Ectocarpus sp. 8 AP-2014]